jgi:hypothetical protein
MKREGGGYRFLLLSCAGEVFQRDMFEKAEGEQRHLLNIRVPFCILLITAF